MKKLLMVLIFLFLLQLALAHELKQGEEITFENRIIKVIALQQEKAIMQVDEEKNIINVDQTEIINGVRIKIVDILYTGDESSSVNFNTELSYSCGDSICSPYENPKSCCKDCACQGNEQCTSSGCLIPKCFLDEDCNDKKELTKDTCKDYQCKYQSISCTKDLQCNDNNPDTDDFCNSGNCQNLPPICKTDEDCQDEDECTLDQCINKDCSYKKIDNCTPQEKKEEKSEEKEIETIQLTEDDEGFFSRIIGWIKNIFS